MKATVECVDCAAVLAELSTLEQTEAGLIESLVAASHATRPHCSHKLRLRLSEVTGIERELSIQCLTCKGPPWITTVPIELVGALTLVFHTAHEGHPLQLTYDGRSWSSPIR